MTLIPLNKKMIKSNILFFEEEEDEILCPNVINERFIDISPNFLFQKEFDNLFPLNQEDNFFSNEFINIVGMPNLSSEIKEINSSKSIIHLEKENNNQNDYNTTFNTSKNNDNTNPKIIKNISFKTVLHHKRGRKEKYKINGKKPHGSGDFDNIQRKVQVTFINFLINLANDAIKAIFGEDTQYSFKDVEYKYKKVVSHNYVEKLKKCKFSDIIKLDVSPKNRSSETNSNKKTFMDVCNLSAELSKLFDKNYLYLFQKYFCLIKSGQDIIDLDGFKIKLSKNTKGLFFLLNKNGDGKEKFIEVVKNVYFSGLNFKHGKKIINSNPFTISRKEHNIF